MGTRSEPVCTLEGCQEALEVLRRTVTLALVWEGMDAERVQALAQHLNGALEVVDAAVQATPAYQSATLLDGAPRAVPVRNRHPAVGT